MKKIGKLFSILITGIFVIISLLMFGRNIYAAEYPSVNDLSEEEKELLPYYQNGWSLSYVNNDIYRKNNYIVDVYYLGCKVKTINSKLEIDGVKYYQNYNERGEYAITDNHQLFMICHQFNGYSGDSYDVMIRYDIDTDSYKTINSVSYLKNTNNCPYVTGIVSNGNDVYLLCRPYLHAYDDTKIFKYDNKKDEFIYSSTIANGIDKNVIYDEEEKSWIGTSYINNKGYQFIKYDFEKGTSNSIDGYYAADGLIMGGRFSWWQVKTGSSYYNKETKVLNTNTGLYNSYTSLYKHDGNTNKDIELIKEDNANYQAGVKYYLDFVTHKGIVVMRNNYTLSSLIFNEDKNTYKTTEDIGIDLFVNRDNHDMWNYYIAGKVYPIYEPTTPKITGSVSTYSDRITINWNAVTIATGYNIYVNGKKVNINSITDTSYIVKGLSKNTIYKIEISALNSVGESNKSTVASVKTGSILLGDINEDGKISIIDAMRIFHYVSGRNKNIEISKADINGDGKINIIDAMKIFHYVSGRNKEY